MFRVVGNSQLAFFPVSELPVVRDVDLCLYYPCRNANRATVVRNVIYDNSICSNNAVLTHGYRTDYAYPRRNQAVVSNNGECWLSVCSAYCDIRTYVNIISNHDFMMNDGTESTIRKTYTFSYLCSQTDVAAKYYSEAKGINESR